ncbi:hypothetical protein QTP70_029867 [Hemibagrus guttatus]|uniref:1-acyl-sn-glycerol-3-phosphate acyltransferase n=1 Tax=Hemibagrus guttatus TaxID=175788 RepID=A0AAE0UYT2_9TELE|nr:hypothetical protein QTP70_029867 [Hemibagrus guttatus]
MDQLSEEVRQESPWTMMFADDIVICSESREQVEENLERWRFALKRRGMKVSHSKTDYLCMNVREGSGTVRLQGEEVKKVQEFKYLGSTVQSNGEFGKEVKKRVQAGWNGWRKVLGVLCDRKISVRIKGEVYRTVVRPAMLNGLETVSLRKRQESELEAAELKMLRIIRFLVWHVKYFLGLRYEVSGWEHLQTEGPYVIISNHQSSLDVLGMMEVLPDRCTIIAKKELLWAGTVGMVCWLGGIVFINRKKTSDAKSVMADTAKIMLHDKIRLWVFPEGTRNQKGDILPFKKGAFHLAVQAQAPIIPIVFSSYSNFYLRKEKEFKSGTITLKILPKIETKGLTSDDVSSLCDRLYAVMSAAFLEVSAQSPQSNGPSNH